MSQVNHDAYERYLRGETEAIPKWMEIRDTDDEAARAKKRAALKALKKKRRCAVLSGAACVQIAAQRTLELAPGVTVAFAPTSAAGRACGAGARQLLSSVLRRHIAMCESNSSAASADCINSDALRSAPQNTCDAACLRATSDHRELACRFEQKDLESTKKANDWQSFQKGSKKKAQGFMTAHKKGSMFSVPDNDGGKVGVVGSGKGMTNASNKRSRLDF